MLIFLIQELYIVGKNHVNLGGLAVNNGGEIIKIQFRYMCIRVRSLRERSAAHNIGK